MLDEIGTQAVRSRCRSPDPRARRIAARTSSNRWSPNRMRPLRSVVNRYASKSSSRASGTAPSTAALVVTGTITNGTPHDTCSTGSPVPANVALVAHRALARRAPTSRTIGPNSGLRCVIQANCRRDRLPFEGDRRRADVQTEHPVRRRHESLPSRASANVLPMTGWPAIGISVPGVKIRIRVSVAGVLGRGHERRLREPDLAGNLLHRAGRQARRLRETRRADCRRTGGR